MIYRALPMRVHWLGIEGLYKFGKYGNLSDGIRFNETAFKHKVSQADIEWAIYHLIRDGLMENLGGPYVRDDRRRSKRTGRAFDQNDAHGRDFGKPGVFARQRELLNVLNPVAADYILTRAMASHKMPSQIIGEMVNKEIAARV
jgi:hypothetical protein